MRALVVGASGGLGSALAEELERRGARVRRLSRSVDGLDLRQEATIEAAAARLRGERFERILVATGALTIQGSPPERALSRLDPAVMVRAFEINAIGPALLFKHFGRSLPRERPSAFAVLSARLASVGDNHLGGWMSYRASKAALNQLMRCAAIELGRIRPEAVVVALHPGTVPTDLSAPYARGRYTAEPDAAAGQLLDVIDALQPGQTGGFFDYSGERIDW